MRHLEVFRSIFSSGPAGELLLAFNGTFSQETIVNLGEAVRHETSVLGNNSISSKAFRIFIEMAQNVQYYSFEHGSAGHGRGRFMLFFNAEGFQLITSNLVDDEGMDFLRKRINGINRMDAEELKASYLSKRRQRKATGNGGAGLGLMDIARRSDEPLGTGFLPEGEGKLRFYLRAIIKIQEVA